MLKPELMKAFVNVCETKSFTVAANVMGLPKTTVSEMIKRLEASVGARLLQRTTRNVTVTQDGAIFLERCKDLLSDFEEAENMFQNAGPIVSGKIRIDLPVGVAKNVIIPTLPKFLELYPKLDIELSCTDRRVDLVREGFDFVIRVGGVGDISLIAKKVGELSIVNCVSPTYIKKYGIPKTIESLNKQHFQIHYSQNFSAKTDGFEYFDGTKYNVHKTKSLITVNSTDAYNAACIAGLGIIQAPLAGVEADLKAGRLKKVLTKYVAEPLPVYLVFVNRRHIPKRVRLLMDWIEKEIITYLK